ncbi:Diacylglycerol kinase eta [Galemys pyrenaicus]|uniref:Diacylglycerol kinase eta n=1 Tax=Galemys pyrenaicus TaxID=202257 RepID=A0A8J6AJP2_GALPY|nr:Diacylglycerol kinase eta [Galemys pyrenaicus]
MEPQHVRPAPGARSPAWEEPVGTAPAPAPSHSPLLPPSGPGSVQEMARDEVPSCFPAGQRFLRRPGSSSRASRSAFVRPPRLSPRGRWRTAGDGPLEDRFRASSTSQLFTCCWSAAGSGGRGETSAGSQVGQGPCTGCPTAATALAGPRRRLANYWEGVWSPHDPSPLGLQAGRGGSAEDGGDSWVRDSGPRLDRDHPLITPAAPPGGAVSPQESERMAGAGGQQHPPGAAGGAAAVTSAAAPAGPGEDSSDSEAEQEGPQKLIRKVSTSGQIRTKVRRTAGEWREGAGSARGDPVTSGADLGAELDPGAWPRGRTAALREGIPGPAGRPRGSATLEHGGLDGGARNQRLGGSVRKS